MNRNLLSGLVCCVCLLGAVCRADDITTVDGRVYRDVAVDKERSDALGIFVAHWAGFAKIPYADMTDADRQKYGYDPQRARKAKADILAKQEAERKRKAKEQAELEARQEDEATARVQAAIQEEQRTTTTRRRLAGHR